MKKARVKYTLGKDVNLDKEIVLDTNGRRITEYRACQITRQTHELVVGRPSLTGAGVQTSEIKARVPMELKKSLQREAKRRGQTSSELVRQAVEVFLRGT